MKLQVVADGKRRLRETPEFRTRLRELRASIRARHADGLAKAGLFRRLPLYWRIEVEYRKEKRKIVPSTHSLYIAR